MKIFILLATCLALSNGFRVLPWPQWPSIKPNPLPEVMPPNPLPPTIHPDVYTEVLNFPSDDDPQIRIHVNMKQQMVQPPINLPQLPEIGHRPELPEGGHRPELPEGGHRPELPESGHKPGVPELPCGHRPELPTYPESGHKPGLPGINLPIVPESGHRPGLPGAGHLPSLPESGHKPGLPGVNLPSIPEAPVEDGIVFIYPNPENQLVKLRVVYNDVPEAGHRPELPEVGHRPELPWIRSLNRRPQVEAPEFPGINLPSLPQEPPTNLPGAPDPIHPLPPTKKPQMELFIDIGEQDIIF